MSTTPRPTWRPSRWLATLILLAIVLLPAAPWLFSHEPLLGWTLRRIFGQVQGSVTARSASFGWTTPTRIEGLRITSPDGQEAVKIERFFLSGSLLKLLFPDDTPWTIRVDQLEVYVLSDRGTSNLARTFPPPPEEDSHREKQPRPARGPFAAAGATVELNDTQLIFQIGAEGQRWQLGPIDFQASIVPATETDSGRPEWHLPPNLLLDRLELSENICNDLLKYPAPGLLRATRPSGQLSLAIHEAKLPLGDARAGTLSGQLVLHSVKFAPGSDSLVQAIARFLKLPADWHVELAHETTVPFQMKQGRVHHQNFELGLGRTRISTSGSVGFDDSLDLVAHVFIRASDAELVGRPVLRALGEQGLRLPIRGTLDQPQIDVAGAGQESIHLVRSILGNWSQDRPEQPVPQALGPLLDALKQGGLLGPPAAAPNGSPAAAPNAGAIIKDAAKLLQELRRKRQQRAAGVRE